VITGSKTALVVDDSKLARYVLKEMLTESGLAVETAESGEEALGMLSAKKPDVIFMDHMMPGMDGFQAVQAIKDDPETAKIPILMYTSKDERVYVDQARAMGAVGVLPKKLKPEQLQKVLLQLKLIPASQVAPTSQVSTSQASRQQQEAIREATQTTLEELSRSASEELEKDSMRALFKDLLDQQFDRFAEKQTQNNQSTNTHWRNQVAQALRFHSLFLIIVVLLGLGWLQWLMQEQQESTRNLIKGITQISEQQHQALMVKVDDMYANTTSVNASNANGWNAMEWALNIRPQLDGGVTLIDPTLVAFYQALVMQLEESQFRGELIVTFHSGRWCQAKSEISADAIFTEQSCLPLSEEDAAVRYEVAKWDAIWQQLATEHPLINMQAKYAGNQFTKVDYPAVNLSPKVLEWQQAAAINHRLEFELNAE